MRETFLSHLVCPLHGGELELKSVSDRRGEQIRTGELIEPGQGCTFPIQEFVPRFAPQSNYASSFGLEWNVHNRTQYDDVSGHGISADRFKVETRWPENLEGELVLEAGSGSGRFTEQALKTGATVISFDYSSAVDANFRSNGAHPNLCLVQADIFQMPFRANWFDKVLCLGVLQHTPDPKAAFMQLVSRLKPSGRIATDIYKKTLFDYWLSSKYWVRPITRNIPPERLYRYVKTYVDFMWPLTRVLRRLPKGTAINWHLLVADYSGALANAPEEVWKEWAYLDTFDMLSPRYDIPATLREFRRWHEEAGLESIDVRYGYNGIEGRGVKSATAV